MVRSQSRLHLLVLSTLSAIHLAAASPPIGVEPAAPVPASAPAPAPAPPIERFTWPAEVTAVTIPASDGASQPAMWYAPAGPGKRPLLVGLHTWSSTYASAGGDAVYAQWCIAQGWAFVHPHFRGPNNTPAAMGSDRAVQDVVEAVAWAKQQTAVDETRIYLIGVSGGGHMALQMAGRHPEIWAGVSAWCGISDIRQWHAEHVKKGQPDRYARHIEAALGGSPAEAGPAREEAWKRSPLSSLARAKGVPLDISHGIDDGRLGSVPFTHSLRAFNAVVGPGPHYLPDSEIAAYYASQTLPPGWPAAPDDPSYGAWKPLFRRIAGQTRVTVFLGKHEIVHQGALNWLALQQKGKPPVWGASTFIPLAVGGGESGK